MRKAKQQTKKLLKRGGMLQEGGTVDPVSGNEVPVGAMQEEVRDDVPAQLSEGEFVFPADVVRYIGLERLMMMRQAAKQGLQKMEEMGQMSNSEEATMEDDAEFESELDEIMGEIEGEEEGEEEEGGEEEEEGGEEEEEAKMAVGGVAMNQQQPMAVPEGMRQQDAQSPSVELSPEQLKYIQDTANNLKSKEPEIAKLPPSNPTQGLSPSAIIKNSFPAEQQDKADEFIKKVDRLNRAKKVISTRHNDTVIIGFVKRPGVLDPYFFSSDAPEKIDEAITTGIEIAKKSGITRLESDTKGNIEPLTKLGYPVQETDKGWSLDLE